MKQLIALTGRRGSGKTSVARELSSYRYHVFSGSEELRRANQEELPPELQSSLSTPDEWNAFQRVYKTVYGPAALGEKAVELLSMQYVQSLCYEGLRNIHDALAIRCAGGIIVALECEAHERYRRVLLRNPERPLTFEEFERENAVEEDSPDAIGLHLSTVMREADIRIDTTQQQPWLTALAIMQQCRMALERRFNP